MKINIMEVGRRAIATVKFKTIKHSPDLLLGSGIAIIIAGTVMAVRASKKTDDILEEHEAQILEVRERKDAVAECLANAEDDAKQELVETEKSVNRDITAVYLHTGFKLAKVYAPAIAVETLGIVCILYSHKIMSDRMAGLGSALTAANAALADYRSNVRERFGDDIDREMRYGVKEVEREITETDEEGNEVKKTVVEKVPNEIMASKYMYLFDSHSKLWQDDPYANLMTLQGRERILNERLRARARENGGRGYMFLNEVLQDLFPDTELEKRGQVIGWVYDEKNPIGSNYIDFGLFWADSNVANKEANDRFLLGLEPTVMLDFNCDGNIFDLM